MINILDALYYIDPSTTDYFDWLHIGMALHHVSKTDPSVSYRDWDNWSSLDSRPGYYVKNLCEKKWNSFQGSGITERTIYKKAFENGFKPQFDGSEPINWNGYIEYDGEEEDLHVQETIEFIKLLYKPEDFVNYCFKSSYDKEKDKYKPADRGIHRKAKDLLNDLIKYNNISEAFGDYNPEAGGWIRFNPTNGKGVTNSDIEDFRYCLIESDQISLENQFKKIIDLKLPCIAITYSGGKSLHAIVHVDAQDQKEYSKRVKWIYEILNENDFPIDQNNKNSSRMTRLPGLKRGNNYQTLVSKRTGLKSFLEWEDYIKNDLEDETLPEIVSYSDIIDNPPPLKEELIKGVLRCGHKMIISGASKSGKSYSLIDLAISIAEGKKWINFECKQGKVLYINFEIDEASFWDRVKRVYEAKNWKPTPENLDVWTLRGYSMPASKLIPKILKRAYSKNYIMIILDPIYKIQAGDENSAGDISKFTNEIDKLVTELNCSVAYCHHHSKGSQGFKRAMDRSSGSGVFSRDADAIIDVIELSNESFKNKEGYSDLTAYRIEGTLREFPSFEPVNVFFDHPIYKVDDKGILKESKTYDEFLLIKQSKSSPKKSKKKSTDKDKSIDLLRAFKTLDVEKNNEVSTNDLTNYLEISDRTLKRRIDTFNHSEFNKHGQFEKSYKTVSFNEKTNK